jgi:hypothetical protein
VDEVFETGDTKQEDTEHEKIGQKAASIYKDVKLSYMEQEYTEQEYKEQDDEQQYLMVDNTEGGSLEQECVIQENGINQEVEGMYKEINLKEMFNVIYIMAASIATSILFLYIIIAARKHRLAEDNAKDEESLVVHKKVKRAKTEADQTKSVNDNPKARKESDRLRHSQTVMVQTEEIIQKAPEIVQEKKQSPKSKVHPETQIEEEKNTGTSSSTPDKDISSVYNKEDILEGKEITKGVRLVVTSNQNEELADYKVVGENGKAVWKNTHFIFILDCSTTMAGARWDSAVDGYIECVKRLNEMENIIISGFSFDTIRNPFCREKVPAKAPLTKSLIPYTGKARKYERALKYIAQIIERCLNKDYLSCVILISNGSGDYTDTDSKELLKQIEAERKVASYIIGAACDRGEDRDMVKLARDVNGEYYRVAEPAVIGNVLLSALEL